MSRGKIIVHGSKINPGTPSSPGVSNKLRGSEIVQGVPNKSRGSQIVLRVPNKSQRAPKGPGGLTDSVSDSLKTYQTETNVTLKPLLRHEESSITVSLNNPKNFEKNLPYNLRQAKNVIPMRE